MAEPVTSDDPDEVTTEDIHWKYLPDVQNDPDYPLFPSRTTGPELSEEVCEVRFSMRRYSWQEAWDEAVERLDSVVRPILVDADPLKTRQLVFFHGTPHPIPGRVVLYYGIWRGFDWIELHEGVTRVDTQPAGSRLFGAISIDGERLLPALKFVRGQIYSSCLMWLSSGEELAEDTLRVWEGMVFDQPHKRSIGVERMIRRALKRDWIAMRLWGDFDDRDLDLQVWGTGEMLAPLVEWLEFNHPDGVIRQG